MRKYELLHDRLLYKEIVEEEDFLSPEILDVKYLEGVHDKCYYQRLRDLKLSSSEIRRIGFPLSPQLVERELRIAEGTIQAAKAAMDYGIGFNVAGGTHHAGSNWGEGFWLLNDQAIAAHYLWEYSGVKKILIIDLDVHQGNGTADIFQNNRDILTFSMHGQNNFPFKKEKSDFDVGLPDRTEGKEYLQVLTKHLEYLFQTVNP